jgi:glycerol-3-phosphate dehydrogenase
LGIEPQRTQRSVLCGGIFCFETLTVLPAQNRDEPIYIKSFFMKKICKMQRLPLTDLSGESFDVVVIGAGINGAGAVQEIAARGYRVLIVDKGDFSSGATNRSSRILHCGLRHLAPGKSVWEFVRNPKKFWVACQNAKKSMDSRSQVAKTMKPLVSPFPFAFPIYKDGPYASWQVDVAFKLLDILGPGDLPLDYVRYNRRNMTAVPFSQWVANPEKLKGFAVFSDYQFLSAERLVVDTLKDAQRLGATVRNYTECIGAKQSGEHWTLELQDSFNSNERATVLGKVVVNTCGPWGDQLTKRLTGNSKRRMVGLKGIHILADLPGELAEWGMMAINSDNETLYCLPWNGMHYIGPTRIPYTQDLDSVVCTEKEQDWMLAEINHIFPKLKLRRQDIHYTYAGIQPVSEDPKDPKGTREIRIHDLSDEGFSNMLMLTGGPIQTYRIVGAQVADAVGSRITPSGSTQKLSYLPSAVTRQIYEERSNGTIGPLSTEVIQKIIKEEQASNLTDLLIRRCDLGWSRNRGQEYLEVTATMMAKILNWDEGQTQAQISSYLRFIEKTFPAYH